MMSTLTPARLSIDRCAPRYAAEGRRLLGVTGLASAEKIPTTRSSREPDQTPVWLGGPTNPLHTNSSPHPLLLEREGGSLSSPSLSKRGGQGVSSRRITADSMGVGPVFSGAPSTALRTGVSRGCLGENRQSPARRRRAGEDTNPFQTPGELNAAPAVLSRASLQRGRGEGEGSELLLRVLSP